MKQLLSWLGIIAGFVAVIWFFNLLASNETAWHYTVWTVVWVTLVTVLYTIAYMICDTCKVDLWAQIRRFLDWTAEVNIGISALDSNTKARLKLLYLVPFIITILPLWCCWTALVEAAAILYELGKTTWITLTKGNLP